jgi:hypothetical protein
VLLENGFEEIEAVVVLDASERLEKVVDVLEVLDVESLEPWRDLRRKGREGARKVGTNAALVWGSDGRRK